MKKLLLVISVFVYPCMSQAQEMVRVMVIGKKQNGCGVMYSATKYGSEVCKQDDADLVETKLKNQIGNSLNLHTKRIYAGQYYAVIKATYQPLMLSCTYTDYAIGVSSVSKIDAIDKAKGYMNSRSGKVVDYELKFDGQVPESKPVTTTANENSSSTDELYNSISSSMEVKQDEWNKQAEAFRNESKSTPEEREKANTSTTSGYGKYRVIQEGNHKVSVEFNGKYGLLDDTGKELFPCIYDYPIKYLGYERNIVVSNKKYGVIDIFSGKTIVPCKYDFISDQITSNYKIEGVTYEGVSHCKLNGKYGVLDRNGNEIAPFIYDNMGYFKDNRAYALFNGKYGFIDMRGKCVIPYQYDGVKDFREGLAAVKLDGKWGFIKKDGEWAIPLFYDEVDGLGFDGGYIAVKIGKAWTVITTTGNEIVPLRLGYTFIFTSKFKESGLFEAVKGQERHFYDKNGNRVK